jgi:hypothetical protein
VATLVASRRLVRPGRRAAVRARKRVLLFTMGLSDERLAKWLTAPLVVRA